MRVRNPTDSIKARGGNGGPKLAGQASQALAPYKPPEDGEGLVAGALATMEARTGLLKRGPWERYSRLGAGGTCVLTEEASPATAASPGGRRGNSNHAPGRERGPRLELRATK